MFCCSDRLQGSFNNLSTPTFLGSVVVLLVSFSFPSTKWLLIVTRVQEVRKVRWKKYYILLISIMYHLNVILFTKSYSNTSLLKQLFGILCSVEVKIQSVYFNVGN